MCQPFISPGRRLTRLMQTSALFPLAAADPPVRGVSPPAVTVAHPLGIAGALLQTALLMEIIVLALQRCSWGLPKGTLTIVFTINGALMAFMRDQAALIPGIVLAGIAGTSCSLA